MQKLVFLCLLDPPLAVPLWPGLCIPGEGLPSSAELMVQCLRLMVLRACRAALGGVGVGNIVPWLKLKAEALFYL